MQRWLLLSGLVVAILTSVSAHAQSLRDALEGTWSRHRSVDFDTRASSSTHWWSLQSSCLLSGSDKAELALVPLADNGLEAKGVFKMPVGTQAVATITLAGKPASTRALKSSDPDRPGFRPLERRNARPRSGAGGSPQGARSPTPPVTD